ncbi:hypothetical protein LCGC14_0965840 [marine sediment metagenome]|uniref:Uncharacterized protein n=1 Tax=marine sediment metagenome TaxID=412755 RepID=A0A0F9QWC1_9ZZZZ
MSWKDLYSEVKKRKIEALDKKDIVQAVEKHGKILAINGRYEKPKKVIEYMYASLKKVVREKEVMKEDLSQYDVVLIGCPGSDLPHAAHQKIRDFVMNGGWLMTTDWALKSIIENIFPGFIRWNRGKTADAVVACQIVQPDHPFLDGVLSEIQQSKWQKQSVKKTKKNEFRWWLETKSFPIQVVNYQAVRVLINSYELQDKWGESPVLVEFDYGKMGGRVIHMISHTHLQKGALRGKYASALILTNILDEKISLKMGISKIPTPRYVSEWETTQPQPQQQFYQTPSEKNLISPSQQDNYLTPAARGIGLTETSQIIEADVNSNNFSFASKCIYCGYDFGEYLGKIYVCQPCNTPYHENCINMQMNEGTCKKCDRILLW